jgi:hypothetical protein
MRRIKPGKYLLLKITLFTAGLSMSFQIENEAVALNFDFLLFGAIVKVKR